MTPETTRAGSPSQEPARSNQSPARETDSRSSTMITPAVGLRRRRAEAWRLDPLASGVRDPFDEQAAAPARQIVYGGYDVVTLGLVCSHGPDCPGHAGRFADERQGDEQRKAA